MRLDDNRGAQLADLFALSSIHPLHDRDDTVGTGAWQKQAGGEYVLVSLFVTSSTWKRKRIVFHCEPQRFTYRVEVEGQGLLAEVNYLGGYSSADPEWGSGSFWSGQQFQRGFNPEPNTDEENYFPPSSGSTVDLMGVPLPAKGDWFFTPPPFCFAFEGANTWLALGVEACAGDNRFTEYTYHAQRGAFFLSLSYEGHTQVDGRYELPAIGFHFADTELKALEMHIHALQKNGNSAPTQHARVSDWWHEPIFCGWGAQCHLAKVDGRNASEYATQANYGRFLDTLEHNGILPGTVVIDDKWQTTYGENCVDEKKFPDLPRFIREQHERGRKVLLWLRAWSPEGLPADECITNRASTPLAGDPTNPAFERRLRDTVRTLLSQHGYDADGFKIDFTARIPSGPGMSTFGDSWGLELLRLYLGIIHDEAKRSKSDALIMTHTPHPYLADLIDMIRLNDINTDKAVNPAMSHRAHIASLACPDTLIDTDNWQMPNKVAWRDYVRLQPQLGVPSLYYVTHIDTTHEPLEAEDYALVRETWAEYRASLNLTSNQDRSLKEIEQV